MVKPVVDEVAHAHEGRSVYYKLFPLTKHPDSMSAAQAAIAAHQQGQFKAMHDTLFARSPQHDKGSVASVSATGSPGLHYQWQKQNGAAWDNVGTDQNTFNTGVLTTTSVYRVIVYANQSGCEDPVSVEVTVIVTPDIAITTQPVGGSICTGGDFNLSVSATGSPALHYQWQAFLAGVWTNAGTDQNTFNTGALTATTNYRVIVYANESGCEDPVSSEVSVIVTPDISINAQPAGTTMCQGGVWTLTASASGSPNILYQWQDSTAAGTWQNVSETGGTTPSFTTDPLSVTTWYRLFVYATESGCEDLFTTTVAVTVVNDPVLTTTGNQTICIGGLGTMSVTVSGGVGTAVYQWQAFNGSWTNIPSGTNSNYSTVFSQLGSFDYRVIVTQGIGCQTVSDPLTITVVDDPTVTITPSATTVCAGGSGYDYFFSCRWRWIYQLSMAAIRDQVSGPMWVQTMQPL